MNPPLARHPTLPSLPYGSNPLPPCPSLSPSRNPLPVGVGKGVQARTQETGSRQSLGLARILPLPLR